MTTDNAQIEVINLPCRQWSSMACNA